MRTYHILLCIILFPFLMRSQNSVSFNYQAAIRNAAGEILFNTPAEFEIEILQNGEVIYYEQHLEENTGVTGVINFKIGAGTNSSGSLFQTDWSSGSYQIRVYLTVDGITEEMGVADIVAVPFALYAQNSGNAHWLKNDSNIHYANGSVGIGAENPSDPLEVKGTVRVTGNGNHFKFRMYSASPNYDNQMVSYNEHAEKIWAIVCGDRDQHDNFLIDRPENNLHDFVISTDGKVGIGMPQDDPKPAFNLDVRGRQRILHPGTDPELLQLKAFGSEQDSWISSFDQLGNRKWILNFLDRDKGDRFAIWNEAKSDDIFWINDNSERTHVKELEIHGGSDGAEYFNITNSKKLDPGTLVVIDTDVEGKLQCSSKPYDTNVAGVISGAGGVKPGVILQQDGLMEGSELVSLWGRVYVKASASNGRIKPGDLLTSSKLEGHVMKAKKNKKSQGAIIGKALSGLEKGEGLVLLLIQPQ